MDDFDDGDDDADNDYEDDDDDDDLQQHEDAFVLINTTIRLRKRLQQGLKRGRYRW